MSAPETGTYPLICFDAVGRRDKRFEDVYRTMTDAQQAGFAHVINKDIASFRVDRVIFNSLDERKERWG